MQITGATTDEVTALAGRLIHGHQTVDRDHVLLAKLLDVGVVVHYGDGLGVAETLSEGSRTMHVQLSMRTDGAGVQQGHFDLLWPKTQPNLTPHSIESRPELVSHAITMKGPDIAASILMGGKDVENRGFALEGQWICVHVGKGPVPANLKRLLYHLIPSLDSSTFPRGCIVGMVFLSTSWSLAEYREYVGCTDACVFEDSPLSTPRHTQSCRCNPFATGPVVNLIKHRIVFNDPIECSGQLGKWPLPAEQHTAVRKVLKEGKFTRTSNSLDFPMEWPLPWLEPHVHRDPLPEKSAQAGTIQNCMCMTNCIHCIYIYVLLFSLDKHNTMKDTIVYIYICLLFS